jgi:hypothetical protein
VPPQPGDDKYHVFALVNFHVLPPRQSRLMATVCVAFPCVFAKPLRVSSAGVIRDE